MMIKKLLKLILRCMSKNKKVKKLKNIYDDFDDDNSQVSKSFKKKQKNYDEFKSSHWDNDNLDIPLFLDDDSEIEDL